MMVLVVASQKGGSGKTTLDTQTAVKPGDITQALADIQRDPTAVARHHLGRKPQPAAVETTASVEAPAADPEPMDRAGSALPISVFETEPVDAAPADLAGDSAAV